MIATPGPGSAHVLNGNEDTLRPTTRADRRLAERLSGQVRMATTVFNPWTTLRQHDRPGIRRARSARRIQERDPREAAYRGSCARPRTPWPGHSMVIAESLVHFVRQLPWLRCRWDLPIGSGRLGRWAGERHGHLRQPGPAGRPGDPGGGRAERSTSCTSAARRSTSAVLPAIRCQVLTGPTARRDRPSPKWPVRLPPAIAPAWITSARW